MNGKGKVMTEFITPASKVYAHLDDNNKEHKNVKGINKCVRDKVLRFNHYMDVLLLNKTIRCTQQRFKSDHHIATTEEVNKIALSRKDDKRIQSFDGITTYPIGIDKDLLNELETEIRNKPIQLYYQLNKQINKDSESTNRTYYYQLFEGIQYTKINKIYIDLFQIIKI